MSNPYKIEYTDTGNRAITASIGCLNVCLCDKTCDNHANLKALLDAGYKLLLHVKDENGNIVPLTKADMVDKG